MLCLAIGSCAPTSSVRGGAGLLEPSPLLPYSGPRARIAVARFADKTAKGYASIGEGMSAMFVTALVGSDRYIVLERDIIDDVIAEQDLGTGGSILPGTEAPAGEIEGAELLLTGAVTEFEPEKFGLGGGIVGLGTLITTAALHEKYNTPVAAAAFTESHIALDVRVVDVATSRIVASVSVEATGQDWGGFVAAEVGGGKTRLPFALGSFKKAATEKAIRKAVDLAVAAVTLQFPHEYFRHSADDFSQGRIFVFSYLNLPEISADLLQEESVRTASSEGEWSSLAANLGLSAGESVAPVDFSRRQVVLITPGRQEAPGKEVVIERAVTFSDRVEFTVFLSSPDTPPAEKVSEASFTPAALLSTEQSQLPLTVVWADRGQ